MSISSFPPILGSKATRDKLNEIITDLNALTGAAATVSDQTTAFYPEYPGVVWHDLEGAPGGYYGYYQQEDGALDTEHAGTGGRNYYEWRAEGASQVSVSAALKWRLPENFSAWQSSGNVIAVSIWTTDASGEAECDITVFRNVTQMAQEVDQDSAAAWGTVGFTSADITGGSWAADDELTILIALRAQNASVIRLGEIILAWRGT